MNHIQKSPKLKTNRKNNIRNQSRRKSSKRRKIKSRSKSYMKKKLKKIKKSRSKFNNKNISRQKDGMRDHIIENYSTQLRKCLQNDRDCEDIYEILDRVLEHYERNIYTKDEKSIFFNSIAWSIPAEQNINDIIKFIRSNKCPYIVEIGSGLGLWASILKKNDIKVHATDDHSWYDGKDKLFYTNEIENINHVDAIKKYNDENACLFLCWPPKDNDLAEYCLQNFNGKYLIYIGQDRGGLNANFEFFSTLKNCCERVKEISEEFSDDLEEKYTETHIFNDLTGISNDNIYFYRITEIGKFILGMQKRENLDNMELIIFDKKFDNKLDSKIEYKNSQYMFEFVLKKQRLRIKDKKTNLFIIAYYPSDACAYKFKDEETVEK